MPERTDVDWTPQFVASMPMEYRAAFDDEAIALHAEIVRRRGERSTSIELWRSLPERVAAVCVVSLDRPGLLSSITAALVAHDLDVVSAHAYCRVSASGVREAVDFLWLRRLDAGVIRERDVVAVGEMVDALARGDARFPSASARRTGRRPTFTSSRARSFGATRIRFVRDDASGAMTLTVEAVDRPGLLLAITKTLFAAGVQIVGLRATTDRGRAVDTFQLVELDGKALARDRVFAIQNAVLTAIDATTPPSSPDLMKET